MRIAVSAGEVSGDKQLAGVIAALKAAYPKADVRGMAGAACREAGVDVVVDCYRHGAAMGIDLLRPLRSILYSYRSMRRLLAEFKPDLLIVVDYPDFNLRLARYAKGLGIKVLYFIPPKVWVWRSGRVELMKKYVDRVAAIFPFEPNFYQRLGYNTVSYVGHPSIDGAPAEIPDRLHSPTLETAPKILLLPGSRKAEVDKLFPPMVRVFGRLAAKHESLSAEVVAAPNMGLDELRRRAAAILPAALLARLSFTTRDAFTVMSHADAAILKSGTCNLEAAMVGLPFVCVYSGSIVAKYAARVLLPIKEFSPVNIIRPHTVPELVQVQIDEAALERHMEKILKKSETRDEMVTRLLGVRESLSGHGGDPLFVGTRSVSERTVRLIESIIGAREGDVSANS